MAGWCQRPLAIPDCRCGRGRGGAEGSCSQEGCGEKGVCQEGCDEEGGRQEGCGEEGRYDCRESAEEGCSQERCGQEGRGEEGRRQEGAPEYGRGIDTGSRDGMGGGRHLGFGLIAARDIGVVLRYCGHRAGPAGSARINPDALVEASDAFVIADERGVLFVYRIAPADLERFGSFADDEESV